MEIVCVAISVYFLILFARIIVSYIQAFSRRPMSPQFQPIVKLVYDLTEPVLAPFRRVIPPIGPLDISVLVVFIVLRIIQQQIGC